MEHQILSATKQHDAYFKSFLQLLVQKFCPLRMYCFNKQIIYGSSEGVFSANEQNFKVNYHLLIITETNTRIDHEVQDYIANLYEDGQITALCHGQQAVADAISRNSRFYIKVISGSEILYDHTGINLQESVVPYDYSKAASKAYDHFQHRLLLAEAFLDGAKERLLKKQFLICTFLLHQAVEQACIGLIRVCLSYRSEFHNLRRLLNLTTAFTNKANEHFFCGSNHDVKLFDLLSKSYSQARYNKAFQIEANEANELYEKVYSFMTIVNDLCEAQIMSLEKEVQDV